MTPSPEPTLRRAVTIELAPLPGGGVGVRTPCKLNLWLVVRGQRADGYHEIDSLMVTLDLMDEIEVSLTAPGILELDVAGGEVVGGEENLCVMAARRFLEAAGRSDGVQIRLQKNIPVGAGLGGGSGNAAGILMALDHLLPGALPADRLAPVAASLGSDVPFFLHGGTARCLGRGELVEPWPVTVELDGILLYPGISVSTKKVYGYSRKFRHTPVNSDILPLNLIGYRVWAGPGSAGRVDDRRAAAPGGGTLSNRENTHEDNTREGGRELPGSRVELTEREGLAGATPGSEATAADPAASENSRGRQGTRAIAGANTAERALQGVIHARKSSLAVRRLSAAVPPGNPPALAGSCEIQVENHLEAAALAACPEIAAAREQMERIGLPRPMVCGSGSSLFAVLDDARRGQAADMLEAARAAGFPHVFHVRSTAGNEDVIPPA